MARPTPLLYRLRQRLAAYNWRRVGVLASISLGLSLALVLYLFGPNNHFFSRLFSAFFVGFWLLAVTFLAAIPFIGWATQHWFGKGWEEEVIPTAGRATHSAKPVVAANRPRRSPTSPI